MPSVQAIEVAPDQLEPGAHFSYADKFSLRGLPSLTAMWTPEGRRVMIPTPGPPQKRYGVGAVDYHTGPTVVLIRRHSRTP